MSINNFDSPSQQCTDTSANITRLVRQQLIREVVGLTIRDTQHRLRKENISILCYGCKVLPVIALPFTSIDTMRLSLPWSYMSSSSMRLSFHQSVLKDTLYWGLNLPILISYYSSHCMFATMTWYSQPHIFNHSSVNCDYSGTQLGCNWLVQ